MKKQNVELNLWCWWIECFGGGWMAVHREICNSSWQVFPSQSFMVICSDPVLLPRTGGRHMPVDRVGHSCTGNMWKLIDFRCNLTYKWLAAYYSPILSADPKVHVVLQFFNLCENFFFFLAASLYTSTLMNKSVLQRSQEGNFYSL